MRLTPTDALEIEERAAKACLSFSDYVRRCALGRRVDTRYDVDAILGLRDVADRVRALYADPRSAVSDDEVRAVLSEIVHAMKRI
nr:hypothetical protein [Trinickia mobilis]